MRFIVVGAGDVGVTLAEQLVGEEHDVVLVERSEAKLSKAASALDIEILLGNGCAPDILIRAGLNTADYVIAVADSDEVNVAACLISKLINPAAKRIARIRDTNLVHKDILQDRLNDFFDLIINPDQAAADYLLRLFKVAGAKEALDFCDGKLRVVGLEVIDQSRFIDRKLKDLTDIRDRLSMLIIALLRDGTLSVPGGNDAIHQGDVIYCITPPDRVSVLFEMAGRNLVASRSAMIWGGGPLGRILAHALEEQGTKVKLIVGGAEPAHEIVDEFQSILVLTGDGKDKNLLVEENIQDMDAFIAVTPDEEDNILSSLLARKLGARTSMALVNKATYLPLVQTIGVDVVVSSRIAAASAIFTHIHADSVLSELSLKYLAAGFAELEVSDEMPISGKTLAEAKIPHGAIIAALEREGEVRIPSGEDTIRAGDKIVVFVTKGAQQKLEKLFDLKLDFLVK